MKPRHRAKYRLARSSPGETTAPVRPLVERLETRGDWAGREVELPIPQRDLVYERIPAALPGHKLADPSPNAPLLKRIVRHPYALEPAGSKRIDLIAPELTAARKPGRPRRDALDVVFADRRQARARPTAQAPALPERRPLPFLRQRDTAEEVHWEHVHGEGL